MIKRDWQRGQRARLAELAGIHRSSLSAILAGKRACSPALCHRLEAAARRILPANSVILWNEWYRSGRPDAGKGTYPYDSVNLRLGYRALQV